MKKQSGFTLIELMVVMAIIAILATAGLSAYTGYIKKARDTVRISDLAAINTIVLSSMATNGIPPAATDSALTDEIEDAISTSNNGKLIKDPLGTNNCFNAVATSGTGGTACTYNYYTCDTGTGYGITALFESSANTSQYTSDASGAGITAVAYDIGSCKASPSTALPLDGSKT